METRVVKTPMGTKVKVGVIKNRIEMSRPKGMRIFVKGYDQRVKDYLRTWITEDLSTGEDFIIKDTGPRRKGKSTLGCRTALDLFPITPDNVVYTARDFAKLADYLPPSEPFDGKFSIIVFDEAGYGMFKQRWYEREQQEVVRLVEVNAAKMLVVILVSPHNDFINKALQGPTMCKLWLDVGLAQTLGKGWASMLKGRYHQFRVAGFWNPFCGFRFDELTGPFWDAYMIKKHNFIREAGKLAAKDHAQTTRLERLLTQLEQEIE